jgi:hypothetical protein
MTHSMSVSIGGGEIEESAQHHMICYAQSVYCIVPQNLGFDDCMLPTGRERERVDRIAELIPFPFIPSLLNACNRHTLCACSARSVHMVCLSLEQP